MLSLLTCNLRLTYCESVEAPMMRINVQFTQPPVDHGTVVTAVFDDTCGSLIQIPTEK